MGDLTCFSTVRNAGYEESENYVPVGQRLITEVHVYLWMGVMVKVCVLDQHTWCHLVACR